MPLLQPAAARAFIDIAISDSVTGATTVKRRARFLSLEHTQRPGGECAALIVVEVTPYAAAAGGGYGPRLSGGNFTACQVTLLAENDTLVDAATGAILAQRRPGQSEAAWQQYIDSFSQNTMLQGDFFGLLREQPLRIGDLIRQHIQQADAMGRFA